jgi:hypothetical protein
MIYEYILLIAMLVSLLMDIAMMDDGIGTS